MPSDASDRYTGDEGPDVVIYELRDWTVDMRAGLETRLALEGIEHQWEAGTGADLEFSFETGQPWEVAADLVVGTDQEERVDLILDELEAGGAELAGVDDEGVDDEAVYAVMSELYVAADRLKDDPEDDALAGQFFDAADRAVAEPAPFGVEDEVWAKVQALARETSTALEGDGDADAVRERSQALRDLLFGYV